MNPTSNMVFLEFRVNLLKLRDPANRTVIMGNALLSVFEQLGEIDTFRSQADFSSEIQRQEHSILPHEFTTDRSQRIPALAHAV